RSRGPPVAADPWARTSPPPRPPVRRAGRARPRRRRRWQARPRLPTAPRARSANSASRLLRRKAARLANLLAGFAESRPPRKRRIRPLAKKSGASAETSLAQPVDDAGPVLRALELLGKLADLEKRPCLQQALRGSRRSLGPPHLGVGRGEASVDVI